MNPFIRTCARLKIGQHFMGFGEKTSLTAEGVVLYKEWDATDKRHYYWEEWELRGFNTIDSWIEYDHYTKKVTRYIPLRTTQSIDLASLTAGQQLTIDTKDGSVPVTVHEVGAGTVEAVQGTFSYHLFKGDVVRYAELHAVDGQRRFSVEIYNDKEFDIYEGHVLSKQAQKSLLGRVVKPINRNIVLYALFIAVALPLSFWPRQETLCTPRTVTSASGITTTENHCTTRTIYGSGGSGSGK